RGEWPGRPPRPTRGTRAGAAPPGVPDGLRVPGAAGAGRPAGRGDRRVRRGGRQGRGAAGGRGRGDRGRRGPAGGPGPAGGGPRGRGGEVAVVAEGPQVALDRLEGDPRVVVHRRGYGGPGDLAGAVVCGRSPAGAGGGDAIAG